MKKMQVGECYQTRDGKKVTIYNIETRLAESIHATIVAYYLHPDLGKISVWGDGALWGKSGNRDASTDLVKLLPVSRKSQEQLYLF